MTRISNRSKQEHTPEVVLLNRQRSVRVDRQRLQEFAKRALRLCLLTPARNENSLARLAEIQVVLISDSRISQLHQRFLQTAGPTDVITFQHGEIFISVETARRQAREFGTSFRYELQLYIVHGLLHLRGFDDSTAAGERRMAVMQQRILCAASD